MSRDRPWLMRTYAGHTSAKASNALYHTNLAKGQTGLSVAFDLPTQTGYDADDVMALGEVGKVGVPIKHLGDMRTLFDGIALHESNTSMTINATAMWIFALYVTVAQEGSSPLTSLKGTTQNDILKEYLARGTYIFPPKESMRLVTDLTTWSVTNTENFNPINVCSYHLQEAGATPVQEIAFTLANAVAVLDAVKATKRVASDDFERLVGRISFFCNAGIRIVEEICKMRTFVALWDEITRDRYGIKDPHNRRFRYGVQVNSLGLTAQQPENNVYRILLEMLSVVASKNARARSVQLPAWNEAIGLPRPWDQQWSLRAQQILAHETDLLEYEDIFDGSRTIEKLTDDLTASARSELENILNMGGAVEAIAYMKKQMVSSQAERRRSIEAGDLTVVGVNDFVNTEVPALSSGSENMQLVDDDAHAAETEDLLRWRSERESAAVEQSLDRLRAAAKTDENLMDATLQCARAGVTTGEWAGCLREVFGEYRPPTGVGGAPATPSTSDSLTRARDRVRQAAEAIGVRKLRLLVAKPGLDGHSNAAEQVAVRARDAGFEVIYQGIRLTPAQIARAAADEDVHAIGISILSGAHNHLVGELLIRLKELGVDIARVPVIVGGVIPPQDTESLRAMGVARVFTPYDYDLTDAMTEIASLIETASLS